jgi:hypothetical protein
MEDIDPIAQLLEARCTEITIAVLADGRRLTVHNAVCGRDIGASCDHVTTNISPEPSVPHTVDFFRTDEVVQLEDEEGCLLYRRPASVV